MHTTASATRELGRRGRRPIRRGVDVDGFESTRAHTFTSSLSIPAPGAVTLSKTPHTTSAKDTPEPPPNEPQGDVPMPSRRAARKSKTDALAAISRASSPPPNTLPPSAPSASTKIPSVLRPVPNNEALDFSSIPRGPPTTQPPRQSPRLFGLDECPTYFPTLKEFGDPITYISSISEEARKFGVCKIVPPKEWKMPFVTNTQTFRFKTRVQRLNSIEATSRAKLNFLEQLYRFHDQGLNRPTIPTIAHKPVDLWILRKEVHKRGGYEHVTRNRLWGDVGRAMGYDGMLGVSTQLKTAYSRIVHPFDTFVAQVRGTSHSGSANMQKYATRSSANSTNSPLRTTPSGSTLSNSTAKGINGHSTVSSPMMNGNARRRSLSPVRSSSESSLSTRGEAEDSKEASESAQPITPNKPPTPLPSSSSKSGRVKPEYVLPMLDESLKGENCEICRAGDDDLHMLLCDGCDRGYHTYCLTPPIPSIPKGQWFCHSCLFDTDYGFDEGEDHSLSSFQRRAADFKRMWFEAHLPAQSAPDATNGTQSRRSANNGGIKVTEDDVEREFWRLVESPYDSVEVEYGADIHSTTHGSAMPTMEGDPLNIYSRDPWNLNNLPILQNSLLRYIKSDISGMTIPWTYVGMVFSTFCWHNEDHYTYSVNYMHWGETKTWYAIPGSEAAKFEEAIKSEAPELFEAQPDLLFQLVTLMNPGRLREAGVKVFVADQRAGEFIITFPQAYHSGFNHGFNFNEAVNFALPAWLPFGRACVRQYREHQKAPVFSHDELLLTITQFSQTVSTAMWLLEHLQEMKDRELEARARIRDAVVDFDEFNDPQDHSEEQYQCSVCKVFCYLSQVKCVCTENVACLEHADSLCVCDDPTFRRITLRTRYTDDEIRTIYDTVADRRALPETWQKRLRDCIDGNPRPPLKALKAVLADADDMGAPEDEVYHLGRFVARAEAWTNLATQYLTRKTPARKRGRKSKGGPEPAETSTEQEYTLEDAWVLLAEVESLGFDCPEVVNLTSAFRHTQTLREQVTTFLELPVEQRELETGEVLVSDCKASLLSFAEMPALEEAVEFLKLLRELDQVDDSSLTLEYVEELLERARANKMDPEHEYYKELLAKRDVGLKWKERADYAVHNKPQTIEELWQIINPLAGTPTVEKTRNILQASWAKAKDMEKTAKAIMSTHRDKRCTPEEAISLINRSSDFAIPIMDELQVLARRGLDFSNIYKSIIRGTYQGDDQHPLTSLFHNLVEWRTEIKRDLWMLNIPAFNEVDDQLTQHEIWLRTHPWWKPGPYPPTSIDSFTEAFAVLQDVIYETRTFDQDMPPPECTCICTSPVHVAASGPTAVQCDSCGAKFHERCISGSCPFCDHHHWDGKIVKPRNYSLSDLQTIYNAAPDLSRSYSAYAKLLSAILSSCQSFSRHIDAFMKTLKPNAHSVPVGVLSRIRHIMRKLYTVQFRWPMNQQHLTTYGAELAVLHRTLAAKPVAHEAPKVHAQLPLPTTYNYQKPKLTFSCEQVSPGSDGCQCVCERSFKISSTNPPLTCKECRRQYHRNCVADLHRPVDEPRWKCPVCAGQQGQVYPDRQLRVRWIGEPNFNKFVDYINWIIRRLSTIPIIRLPDPRPNEPVITLTLVRWSQNPTLPRPPSPMTMSGKRKPGRPPTKRPTDPMNGAPIAMSGGNRPPEAQSANGTTGMDNPGIATPSPRSASPQASSGSASAAGDAPPLSEMPLTTRDPPPGQYVFPAKHSPVQLPHSRSKLRASVAGEHQPKYPLGEIARVEAAPNSMAEERNRNDEPASGTRHASRAITPDTSRIRELVLDPALDARKRKASNDTYPQPSPKAARVVSDSPREGSAVHIDNRPHVVTPRIEALVAPTSPP